MSSTEGRDVSLEVERARAERRAAILKRLAERAPLCFLCKWILEDLQKNGALTGYPSDFVGQPVFPRQGKVAHLQLEGLGS